jgi:hypothetical protein
MIFAITLLSLIAISSVVGITFGIYGYASAKLWERYAKKMTGNEWEEEFAKYAIRRHQTYVGFKIYTSWDPNINQWSKQIFFQWFKKQVKLISFKINKPDWWQN